MEYKVRKHNLPIATVIKDYLNKQGGKVTSSRNDIERRFKLWTGDIRNRFSMLSFNQGNLTGSGHI